MGWTKDSLRNPYNQTQIDALIDGIKNDFPTLTHLGVSVPMNTQAEATAQGVTPFSLEPAAYAARFMNKIHAVGLNVLFRGTNCYFEGIYDFPKINFQNGTVANWQSSPTSFIGRTGNFITANIGLFATGDIIAPFPEASSHQGLTDGGNYNQFFLDLRTVLDSICANNGLSCHNNFFSHLWTSAIQNTYNSQYTSFGMATYDHYGTALGLNKRKSGGDSARQLSISGSDTYTVPTSITENNSNRQHFYPDKEAFNTEIDVYIVNKGTGDWTMTIHDGSNVLVKIPTSSANITALTTTGIATKTNASITNNAWNTFAVNWWNPAPDVQYHFHLTSTVADGTARVSSGNSGNMNEVAFEQFKGNASPEALEIDIRNTYSRTWVPQFLQEWGDFWSTDSALSNPVRNQAQHEAYLDSFYAAMQRLADDNILRGFNYWRNGSGGGTHEGIINSVSAGQAYTYDLLYEGERLKAFFDANEDASEGDGLVNLKKINALASASIKSRNGLAIGSVKSINSLQ